MQDRPGPRTKSGVRLLTLAMLAGFAAQHLFGGPSLGMAAWLREAAFAPTTVLGAPWQLFTAPFLYAGFWHFLVDLVLLSMVGPPLERALGRGRLLALAALGAFGALGTRALLAPADPTPFLAAPALAGALLVGLLLAYPGGRVPVFFVLPVRARTLVLVFALLELVLLLDNGWPALAVYATLAALPLAAAFVWFLRRGAAGGDGARTGRDPATAAPSAGDRPGQVIELSKDENGNWR